MPNHLGEYIQARREELGLGRGEIARRLGYTNLSRGSRRLCNLEDGGWAGKDFLRRLIELLQIEPQVVKELIVRDRQEYVEAWNRWADEPVPMHAVVRCLPGLMGTIKMPDGVTSPEQAVAWAVETAQRIGKKIIVVASRRVCFTIHENGRVDGLIVATADNDVMPCVGIGNKRFLFNFQSIGEVEPPKP